MKKIRLLALFLFVTIILNSCATLFLGSKQTVYLESEPPGAKVFLNNIDTESKTPCQLNIKKNEIIQTQYNQKNECVYRFEKDGHTDVTYRDKSRASWLIGLDFYFYVVGGLVDLNTKAHRVYDNNISVILPSETIRIY